MATRDMPVMGTARRTSNAYAVGDMAAASSQSLRSSLLYDPTQFSQLQGGGSWAGDVVEQSMTFPVDKTEEWDMRIRQAGFGAGGGADRQDREAAACAALGMMMAAAEKKAQAAPVKQQVQQKEKIVAKNTRRLVQVIIVDPDSRVPVEQSIVYMGEQKLTDLDDSELFFELDIKSLLAAHNDKRTKVVNKAVKDRTEYLEPARVRDLKMNVVVSAEFGA